MKSLIVKFCIIAAILSLFTDQSIGANFNIVSEQKPQELVDSLNNLSYQNRRSNPRLSLEYALKAYDACSKLNYQEGLAFAIHNLGTAKAVLGNFEKGLEDLLTASLIREEINDLDGLVSTYNNIGFVFSEISNDDKALEYYEKALEAQKKTGKTKDVGIILNNIGHVHFRKQNYEQALNYFYQALEVNKSDDDERGIGASKSNIGNVYRSIGEHDKSLKYHLEALEVGQRFNDKYGVISTLRYIAQDYIKLNNLDKALRYAQMSLDLAQEIESKGEEKNAVEILAQIYEQKGNITYAIKYYKTLNSLKDSIYSTEKEDVLSRVQVVHELEQQAKENEYLLKEQQINSQKIKMQYYLLGLAGFFIVVVVVFAGYIIFANVKVKKINKALVQKNEEVITQKETIQSKVRALDEKNEELKSINQIKDKLISVIAHDLKNPFNSISGYSEVIITQLKSYSESELLSFLRIIHDNAIKGNMLLDNLLQWSRLQTNTLQFSPDKQNLFRLVIDELFFVQHTAKEKNIQINTDIDKNLFVFADTNMLKTIIRNLVSNSIKFTRNNGVVNILAKTTTNGVLIEVNDTGTGISPEVKEKLFTGQSGVTTTGENGEKGTGLGLMICKDFVDMHQGQIWAESTVGEGTSVFIELPNNAKS